MGTLGALLILGGLALPGAAGEAHRRAALPARVMVTLPGGLQASLIQFGMVPKVSIVVALRMGRIEEGEDVWLTKVAGNLLKEGTLHRSADEVTDRIRSMGGQLDVRTTEDELVLTLEVLSEFAPSAIALLGEIVLQPRMTEAALGRAQTNLSRELDVLQRYPGVTANAALMVELYPQHPYGTSLPTRAVLSSYTLDGVRRYYEHNLGVHRTSISVIGKFRLRETQQALQRTFGSMPSGSKPRQLVAPSGPPVVKLVDMPESQQSSIRIGRRMIAPGHPAFVATTAVNAILGGSLTSRITRNLREAKGWTYSPSSQMATVADAAAWIEYVEVRAEVTGPALSEIFKEIETLRATPPSAAELEAAKNFIHGQFLMSSAGRRGVAENFAFIRLHGLQDDWFSVFRDQLYALTPADVQSAAREYFDPAAMSVVVVGNLELIAGQVKRFMTERGMTAELQVTAD